jgi:hypothetical protein
MLSVGCSHDLSMKILAAAADSSTKDIQRRTFAGRCWMFKVECGALDVLHDSLMKVLPATTELSFEDVTPVMPVRCWLLDVQG